jgi:hypothetical protein
MIGTEEMPLLPNGKIDFQHVRRVAAMAGDSIREYRSRSRG